MTTSPEFLPPDTIAYLRFADGTARFPVRPMAPGEYLIGSGRQCHLRLGGLPLPEVHSTIHVTSTDTTIRVLDETVPLVINGDVRRTARLHDGDLVEIDEVRFVFRTVTSVTSVPLDDVLGTGGVERRLAAAIEQMTAAELVDAMNESMTVVATCSEAPTDQVRQLLEAARAVSGHAAPPNRTPTAEIAAIQRQLTFQSERLDAICVVLEQLVQQQRLTAAALNSLTDRVAQQTDTSRSADSSRSLRASA